MKRILILIILLFAIQAEGATYYVSPDGDGSDGTTWAKAYKTIGDAITAHHSGTEIIEVDGGTSGKSYAEKVILGYSDGMVIQGSSENGHSGTVTVNCAGLGGACINTGAKNGTIKRMTFSGADSGYANIKIGNSTGTVLIEDVISSGGDYGLDATKDAGNVIINRSTFSGNGANNFNSLRINYHSTGGASWIFNYCKIVDGLGIGAYILSPASVVFNNTLFMRNVRYGISASATSPATVVANNSIFIANNLTIAGYTQVSGQTSGGTTTLNNCLGLGAANAPASLYVNVTNNNHITNVSPQFTRNAKTGVLVFIKDDSEDDTEISDLATAAEAYGYRVTWAVNSSEMAADDWALARNLVSRGHDIANHGRYHVTLGTLNAFVIQYSGTTATMNIVPGVSLTTSVTGGTGSNLNINLATYTKVRDLCTYIAAQTGYTCTHDNAQGNARTTDLAAVTTQDIKTSTYTALLDGPTFYANIIDGGKSDIETNIPGYTSTAYVPASNSLDAGSRAALKTAGYLGSRGGDAWATGNYNMASLPIYNILTLMASSEIGTANLTRNATALFEWMCEYGAIVTIYDHKFAAYSLANWETIFSIAQKSNVSVLTMTDAINYIIANGSTADSGVTYTRTFTNLSDNRLKSSSPAINAGVFVPGVHDVAGVTDFAGRPIRGNPDIGAYEYSGGKKRIYLRNKLKLN